MSSIRVITDQFGRQFTADSMDRFGDDLCRLVMSYLLCEDKHRLEDVSKQWQRLLRDLIDEIYIIISKGSPAKWELLKYTKLNTAFVVKDRQSVERLKKLLDRYPNVNRIVFKARGLQIKQLVLKAIHEKCHRLSELSFLEWIWNKKDVEVFRKYIGPKLKTVRVINTGYQNSEEAIFRYCPNVETLECPRLSIFKDNLSEYLPKLRSLKTRVSRSDVSLIAVFGKEYQNHLKSLRLSVSDISTDQLEYVFSGVPTLNALTDLEIWIARIETDGNVITIGHQLHDLCSQMKKLKRFNLFIDSEVDIDSTLWQTLAAIAKCRPELTIQLTVNTRRTGDVLPVNDITSNLKISFNNGVTFDPFHLY